MEYYHAFTRGLEKDLLFYGDAEFLYGMNIIPRYLKLSGTRLLAFCLMDNHVHFVLEGCRAACNQFIINYKRTVFSFLKKCRERDIPETTVPGIVGIESTDSLLTVIAYVLRNPVAAGINYLPQDYKWSSAPDLFQKALQHRRKGSKRCLWYGARHYGQRDGQRYSQCGRQLHTRHGRQLHAPHIGQLHAPEDRGTPTQREKTLLHRRPGISRALDSRRQRHDISGKLHRSG